MNIRQANSEGYTHTHIIIEPLFCRKTRKTVLKTCREKICQVWGRSVMSQKSAFRNKGSQEDTARHSQSKEMTTVQVLSPPTFPRLRFLTENKT